MIQIQKQIDFRVNTGSASLQNKSPNPALGTETSRSGQEAGRAGRLLRPGSRGHKNKSSRGSLWFSSQSPEQSESRSPTESPELLGECFISLYCFQLQYFFFSS